MKKKNILMIGMPASGKSTIGVLLAKRLGYSFVDVDLVIQEKTGKLQSKAHLAFEPLLFHRQHDSFINAFDEQRHAEKDRNPIFHDVFLQILQTVAVGCRRARRQHDKLSGSTEGVVIRQKSHVDVASADILAKLQRVNIFDNIVL